MNILVVGGDKLNSSILSVLKDFGAEKVIHWDARKVKKNRYKKLPINIDTVVMITDFLGHHSMQHYKKESKKKNLTFICTKHSRPCIYSQFVKIFGEEFCKNCPLNRNN